MASARTVLQGRLRAINAGKDDAGAALLPRLIQGEPISITFPTRSVTFRRKDNHVAAEVERTPELKELELVNLVGEVGVDRVRQCRLVEDGKPCGRWFIANRRQEYCSLAHGNRDGYLRWKARHKGKRGS